MAAASPEPRQHQRNTVGLVALILSVVGCVVAAIPSLSALGWVLLPLALVLSIIGMCRSGRPKRSSVAAFILSIVGLAICVIVFAMGAYDYYSDMLSR